jgi:hypothetical protein
MYHFDEKRFRKNSTRPIVEHLPWTGTRTSMQRGYRNFKSPFALAYRRHLAACSIL